MKKMENEGVFIFLFSSVNKDWNHRLKKKEKSFGNVLS